MSEKRPEPLKGKTIYTAQVLTDDTATTNFVSKKVYEQFDKCGGRHELFEKDKVKSAVEWLKGAIRNVPPESRIDPVASEAIITMVDEAFPDVVD